MSKTHPDEVKECFTLFDKDGDGKISCQELGTLIRSLGQNPTEAEVEEIARNTIKNSSFSVSDLQSVMSRFTSNPAEKAEEVREAFSVFDRDGTGSISVVELRHIMTNLGEKLTDQEVNDLIKEIDVDNDGQIMYADVVRLMCNK